ncbi:phosphoribosyltransferase family protein [bacterium]|nr:phosphoribosyltransferase family protein [bacterium]
MTPKKKYIKWKELDKQVSYLSKKIKNVDYVVGIPRGGLILAVMMSHRLNIKHMSIDHLEKLEEFDLNINKKNILIVDDISDSGHTLKHYKKQGYTTATLDVRNTTVTKPDYYCNWLETTDWIVYPWEKKDSKTIQNYLDN